MQHICIICWGKAEVSLKGKGRWNNFVSSVTSKTNDSHKKIFFVDELSIHLWCKKESLQKQAQLSFCMILKVWNHVIKCYKCCSLCKNRFASICWYFYSIRWIGRSSSVILNFKETAKSSAARLSPERTAVCDRRKTGEGGSRSVRKTN